MSHWVEIKCEIRDLDSLAQAARELQLNLIRAPQGQKVKARGYYGEMECDAYIRLKGQYDVALTRGKDGVYGMQVDWYGGAANEIGKDGCKLIQLYGVARTEQAARKLGHAVTRQVLKSGAINVLISSGRF